MALSPDGRYLALLNNGRGTAASGYSHSIAVLDVQTNRLSDYPDSRFQVEAKKTYFLGLAFSGDGKRLYASVASLTDPAGELKGDTGNGIAVYTFSDGRVTPQSFLKIPSNRSASASGERLGLPPMNQNDAQAAAKAPLFSGSGDQPPSRLTARTCIAALSTK